jgi:DNA-binding NarL/FixJ family response regulator
VIDHNGQPARGLNRVRHRRRPARVLLCLDDSVFGEVVRTSLQRLDRIEVVASDARDIDVVVLDGDSGEPAELVASVERMVRIGDDVRVIVLLADEDHRLIGLLLDAGATSCVSKSVYPSDLGAVIRQAARGTVFRRPEALASDPTVSSTSGGAGSVDPTLTRRELQILRLARDGVGNKEIARDLWITEQTVKFHLSNVYRKLGVSNRTRASRVAEQHGLLSIIALVGVV